MIDVWASEGSRARFGAERLGPAVRAVTRRAVPPQPPSVFDAERGIEVLTRRPTPTGGT